MQKVIFTRGIPGSGKTTWAKSWVEEDPSHRIRINWDDIRRMFGPYWVPDREDLVVKSSVEMLKAALEKGYSVVIDNMNFSPKCTECFKPYLHDINIIYKDFKTPVEECIARDALRPEPIGKKVIYEIYSKHKDFYDSSNL